MLPPPDPLRQPDLYWKQLAQLKVACVCARLYRNQLARRVQAVESIKAIASSGGVAGWLIWRDFPILWTSIIAASQLLDAVKGVFPFARHHKAACDLSSAMEVIYIDAEYEWENIHAGKVPDDEINKQRTKLRKLQLETEMRNFPDGFAASPAIIRLAIMEATDYLKMTFNRDAIR